MSRGGKKRRHMLPAATVMACAVWNSFTWMPPRIFLPSSMIWFRQGHMWCMLGKNTSYPLPRPAGWEKPLCKDFQWSFETFRGQPCTLTEFPEENCSATEKRRHRQIKALSLRTGQGNGGARQVRPMHMQRSSSGPHCQRGRNSLVTKAPFPLLRPCYYCVWNRW